MNLLDIVKRLLKKFIKEYIIESYDLLFVSIIIVLGIMLYIKYETYNMESKDINNIIKECRTGDLILFRWHFMDMFFRTVSKYNHIGMVYKDEKNVYIIEMHSEEGDDIIRSGVNKYHLKERLNEYNGSCYYLKLDKDKIIDNQELKHILKKYKKIQFDDNFRYSYIKSWLYKKLNWKVNKKNKMYCSEFIEYLLKDLKISPKNRDTSLSTPALVENIYINGKKLYNKIYKINL